MDMLRINWFPIFYCCLWVALIRFSKFWFVLNCCEFYSTPMKIHTMVRKVKKQNKFTFSLLVRKNYQVCSTPNRIIVQWPLFFLCYNLPLRCLSKTTWLWVLFAKFPHTFHSAESFSFKLKRNTVRILCS